MRFRMRTVFGTLLAIPLLGVLTLSAHAQQAPAHDAAAPVPELIPQLKELKGVVSWDTLAKVKQVRVKDRILPQFGKEVTALNNQDVKVQGFMMPLEPGERQKHFLLSVTPQSCSFCLPAGPEGVVEVKSKTPVKYTMEPIVVSGKMSVMKDDPMGLYYRLTNAAPGAAN